MKIEVDFKEASTIRSSVRLITWLVAIVFYWFGKDPLPLVAVGEATAAGIGVGLKDTQA